MDIYRHPSSRQKWKPRADRALPSADSFNREEIFFYFGHFLKKLRNESETYLQDLTSLCRANQFDMTHEEITPMHMM
jgi:hypothetical protein